MKSESCIYPKGILACAGNKEQAQTVREEESSSMLSQEKQIPKSIETFDIFRCAAKANRNAAEAILATDLYPWVKTISSSACVGNDPLGLTGLILSQKHLSSLSRERKSTMTSKMDKRVVFAVMGTAAVGAGAGLAYYLYKKRCQDASDMSPCVSLEVEVEQTHATWLDGIAVKYTNGDSVKALHMLVEHCKTASSDDAVAEAIFKKVRCKACGKKEKVAFTATLSKDHVAFIDSALEKYKISGGQDKTLRVMFEYVINETQESAVFGG